MKQAFSTTATPDTASVGSYLRRYAHFEGEAPPPAPAAAPPPTETLPEKGGNGEKGKVYSQSEVEDLIKERLTRAAGSERKKAYEELGIEDPTTDAELLKAAKAKREADKSELEKAAGAAQKALERAEKAEADLATEKAERILDLRNSKIEAKAGQAYDVDAILEWANRPANADLLAKTVSADGAVSEKAVDELIAACQKAAAHLWKKGGVGSPSNSDGRVPSGTDKAAEARIRLNNLNRIKG